MQDDSVRCSPASGGLISLSNRSACARSGKSSATDTPEMCSGGAGAGGVRVARDGVAHRAEERGVGRLNLVPVTLREANAHTARLHRHTAPVTGRKFSIAVTNVDEQIRGVSIVGRSCARHLDDGWTVEVLRVTTDGCPNACSMLYAACWRAARAMGYRRCITYTLLTEPGTSLRAVGWRVVGVVKAQSWHRQSQPRVDLAPLRGKLRWEVA